MHRLVQDLTGKRFGRLTVAHRVSQPVDVKSQGTFWKCVCTCGNETVVSRRALVQKNSTSCGCYRTEVTRARQTVNLVGKTFGKLVVYNYVQIPGKRVKWLCKCACGNLHVANSGDLRGGKTRSCGCLHQEVMSAFTGEQSFGWKGGKTTTSSGYVNVYIPTHPNANSVGYVLEHRLVMEQQLKRYLTPQETVHHKNGIKTDNRIENLELKVSAHSPGQSPCDLIKHAVEILQKYAPEKLSSSLKEVSCDN